MEVYLFSLWKKGGRRSDEEKDVSVLKKGQKQNHIVTPATGRTLFDAKRIMDKYSLNCPIIASNGTQIYVDSQKIYEHFISSDVIQLFQDRQERSSSKLENES